jgi:hypothetical protein
MTAIAWLALLLQTGQTVPAPTPAQTPAPAPATGTAPLPSDDIIVEGVRDLIDLDDPDSAVTRGTLGSQKAQQGGEGVIGSRRTFAVAMRFARCAMRPGQKDLVYLRGTLDDTINSARQRFQQTRYVQTNVTCTQDPTIAQSTGIAAAVPEGYNPVIYNRGALYIRAIQVFAPGFKLSKAMTADPAVQRRFDAREVPLARFRLKADRAYFETAVCLVRMQPELATRLIHTDDYDAQTRIESQIVNGSKPCVGGAKKVYFDPMQLRIYLADATYRWMIAAQGVTTLIPA